MRLYTAGARVVISSRRGFIPAKPVVRRAGHSAPACASDPRSGSPRACREEVATSPHSRPYDLRHAAVSTWLNSGVPAPQVAAGHSVNVLLRVYAKCIVGQDDAVRRRVEQALRDG